MTDAITIALISFGGAIIGSGGITAVINHILSHKGKTAKQLDHIEEEIKALDCKIDRNEAQHARTQILRFADEIYLGQKHTKEHFDEILGQINIYNTYCSDHKDFENQRTVQAQKRITDVYEQCLEKHTFLEGEK